MYAVVVKNESGQAYQILDYIGSSWVLKAGYRQFIQANSTLVVGGLAQVWAADQNYGWIVIGPTEDSPTMGQIYLYAGHDRGIVDYCIQDYDGGKNASGAGLKKGVSQTTIGNSDGVIFTITDDFDPKNLKDYPS